MKILEIVGKESVLPLFIEGDQDVTGVHIRNLQDFNYGKDYDLVFVGFALQTVERGEVRQAIKKIAELVKNCGEVWLITPAIEWAAKEINAGRLSGPVQYSIFGEENRSCFTLLALRELAEHAGLIIRKANQGLYKMEFGGQVVTLPYNIVIAARFDALDNPAAAID